MEASNTLKEMKILNKLLKSSMLLLLMTVLTIVTIPDAYASAVWTKQSPFNGA